MPKKPYVTPGIVVLDLTKPEVTALRQYLRSEAAARPLGQPEPKPALARIVARLRDSHRP